MIAIGEVGDVREDIAPAPRSSEARASIRSAVVEVIATPAPRRASSRAVAKPIPLSLPQPVTSAVRPVKSNGLSAPIAMSLIGSTFESALESHPDRERGKTALANESSQGGSGMEAQIGDNIVFESERVGQPAHSGVIEEVLKQHPPRYRIRWEDGHESIVAPAAGAARIEPKKQPAKR
jgi:Domain of unknown function (DUF1918)